MGHSKNGGTRTYLRGRVGSDVYSIGKDAQGNKQQVVRSLAESVANPQTRAQMRGRMIMSTLMQAVSAMRPIIDHSFDAVPAGQPCISEFIKRNYKLIKADVASNPANGNFFGLNAYQEKGIKQGLYVISAGNAANIKGVAVDATAKTLTIALAAGATIADLRNALGIGANDYFTLCAILNTKEFIYERFHIDSTKSASEVISADNVSTLFLLDGNTSATFALSGTNIVITMAKMSANYGIIVSRKVDDGYKHNNVTLVGNGDYAMPANSALPTYPIGDARFLNGGSDAQESVPEVDPTPAPTTSVQISAATIDGQAWAKNSTKSGVPGTAKSVVLTIANFDENKTIYFGPSNGSGGFAVTAASQTGQINASADGTLSYKLWVDGENVQTWGSVAWATPGDGGDDV